MASLDDLAGKLADVVSALQGPGLEVAKAAARTEAYSALAAGAFCGLLAAAIAGALYLMLTKAKDWDEAAIVVLGAIGGLAIAVLVPCALWSFVDPWVWTTIAQPEQWIAKKALGWK
jgi:hypothetical protein